MKPEIDERKLSPDYSKLICTLHSSKGLGLLGFTLGAPIAVLRSMI